MKLVFAINNCIHAKGKNADLIAFGAFTMLLLIGIAALTKKQLTKFLS